ncbi:CotH kinase family protein [Metabacillus sp. GX 13764]|uniref:CotH kinase family protein n=1 Tax=Metabacillus kandeliae TaxID=2900151 RepID=UPI001E337CF8|nr:CotH kinase family protein [Metabacillus kandeliae]MCD7035426.1 CotH kinase family protein [Metabacillus kandeliae]
MGLPIYRISMDQKRRKKLQARVWSEKLLPADLAINGGEKQTAGIRYRGHHTRKKRKKSFDLVLGSGKTIHLNAEYSDPSVIRNKLSLDFFREIGVLAPEAEHIELYLNEEYMGVYLSIESFNRHFLRVRNLPEGAVYYAVHDSANFSLLAPDRKVKKSLDAGYTRVIGNEKSDQHLKNFIKWINLSSSGQFEAEIDQYLNREGYFLWLAGAVCTQNFDGFIHNYALYLHPSAGQFFISPWDYDGTWGRDLNGREMSCDYVPAGGYNTLTKRLLECKPFKEQYKRLLLRILEEHFLPEKVYENALRLSAGIRSALERDPHYSPLEAFDGEAAYIKRFTDARKEYLKNSLNLL